MDINLSILFDSNYKPPTYQTLDKRALVSGNPEHVDQYIREMKKYYTHHRMYDHMKELHANYTTITADAIRDSLERWDSDQGRAMMAAEKSLVTVTDKKYSWSPRLRNSALIRKYWKVRLREMDFDEDFSQTFHRLLRDNQRIDTTFSFPHLGEQLERDVISHKFTEATNDFRNVNAAPKICEFNHIMIYCFRMSTTKIRPHVRSPVVN